MEGTSKRFQMCEVSFLRLNYFVHSGWEWKDASVGHTHTMLMSPLNALTPLERCGGMPSGTCAEADPVQCVWLPPTRYPHSHHGPLGKRQVYSPHAPCWAHTDGPGSRKQSSCVMLLRE